MRAVRILGLGLVVLAASAAPILAQEASNVVRAGVQYTFVSGTSSYEVYGDNVDIEVDDAVGFYLAYEWRSKLLGVELNAGYSKHDGTTNYSYDLPGKSSITASGSGSFTMYPINLALNFHVFGRSWVDLYLGPVVGYYILSDELDSTWGYGAQLGADWNVSEKGLAINTVVRYQWVSSDISGLGESLDLNPLTGQLGLAYRW
jgi:outer membrane protein W